MLRKRVVYVLVQVSCTAFLYNSMSCSDDVYVGGYNKDLEHIDSSFYDKSRKINTGHG